MKRQAYQHPELRDANDNIIQQGAFGKNTALANSTNDGWIDYVANDLEALYDNINGSRIYVKNKDALTTPGDISAMYIAEDTGKWYLWDGTKYIETDNARKIADEAIAARDAAKASANDAANSAREQQADWNVTDTTSKAFIKNKPDVLTYEFTQPQANVHTPFKNNCIQSIAGVPSEDIPDNVYTWGVQATLGKIGLNSGGNTRIYLPHRGGMYFKNCWNNDNGSGWHTVIDDKNFTSYALPKDGTAVKATADAAGNNIQNTYVKKSDLASSLSTTSLTVSGETSVPTANEGNSSKAIANTEYVQGELTNYLPLSGGTLTGVVNGVTPTAGDNSTKIATTEFVNAKAGNYLPLTGGTLTGVLTNKGSTNIPINIKTTGTDYRDIQIESSDGNHRIAAIRASKTSEGRCEITIGASTTSNAAPEGITISRSTTNIYATAPTPDATDNSQKIATTRFVRTIVPAGVVLAYARGAVPTGWLLCDGSAVSRTDYAALYAVIGTTYGTGNGSTTFNLPNLVDKFVEGSATAGTVKSAGLPNITGNAYVNASRYYSTVTFSTNAANGSLQLSDSVAKVSNGTDAVDVSPAQPRGITLDASRSSSIYGNSNTVQPPAVTMRYIIKY